MIQNSKDKIEAMTNVKHTTNNQEADTASHIMLQAFMKIRPTKKNNK